MHREINQHKSYLELIFNATEDSIFLVDLNKKILSANLAASKRLNLSLEEMIGQLIFDLFPKEVSDNGSSKFDKVLRNGEPVFFEDRRFDKYFENSYFPIKDESGKACNVLIYSKDITEQKRSEEKYYSLFEQSADYIFIMKSENKQIPIIVDANESALIAHGYSLIELIDQPITFLNPYSTVEENQERINQLDTVGQVTFTTKHKRKDGSVFDLEIKAKQILINNEKFILSFERDITDRQRAEIALRASEEKYRQLFETMTDCFIQVKMDGQITGVNQSFINMLGYSEDELLKLTFRDITPAKWHKFESKVIGSQIELKGFSEIYEKEYIRKDGTIFPVELRTYLLKNEAGDSIGMWAIVRDITDRKKTEDALKTSEHLLKESQKIAKLGHYDLNILTGYWTSSDTLNKVFGIDWDFETSFEGWMSIIHPDDQDMMLEYFQNDVLEKHQFFEKEYRIVRQNDKQVRWVLGLGNLEFNENLIPVRMFGNIQDITDRKQFEQALIDSKNKAEEGDKLKSSFLQNMSHEIRTPLNGIMGFSTLLNDFESLNREEIKEYISLILGSSKRLLGIVDDVLQISRLDTGMLVANNTIFPIIEIFQYFSSLYSQKIAAKSLQFKMNIPDECQNLSIQTDRDKFYQIITNLLNNALKFTDEGYIELGCRLSSNLVQFYIKDTGIGIAEQFIPKIFDRFWQFEAFSNRKFGGTGLGLSIIKGLADLIEAKIEVDSEHGIGSIFIVSLQLAVKTNEYQEKQISEAELHQEIKLKGLKILIVEDEETNYYYLSKLLKNEGVHLTWVQNGFEAIESTNNEDFHLILMDLKMPLMDGFEATRIIRETNKTIPIIAQTAYSHQDERTRAIESGCNEFISKPIKKDDFYNIIQSVIIKN